MKNKLLQLLTANANRRPNALASGDDSTLYLYDVIDPNFGVSAQEFTKSISAMKGRPVTLRINSPGGDVFDGRAMATAIAQHGNVTAVIDGLAASAATYVALAAKEVRMAEGAFFMIHNAWTLAFGNKNDLLETAALLEKIDASLVNDYAKKTGREAQEIADWMAAETWFTAEEARDYGFVDAIVESASASARWDVSAFDRPPAALLAPMVDAPIDDDQTHVMQRNRNRMRLYEIG